MLAIISILINRRAYAIHAAAAAAPVDQMLSASARAVINAAIIAQVRSDFLGDY